MEAMAIGCTVIDEGLPHSGEAWVCGDGENRLTVPVNDSAAFGAAPRRLLKKSGMWDRLAAKAGKLAVARFDHCVMAERILMVHWRVMVAGRGVGG